ncbi:hypothetical protein M885DRAFT_234354 [Pelagophyceae sp. CCMP2097]|nr:hypothetical protein M885DRAFT_234354 [Pelagophyceae sp. CCMP2097]
MLCSICMDRPSNRRIDCAGSHEFCAQCIEDWKKTDQGDSCPNCRTAFGKIFEPTAHKVDAPRAAPAPQLSRNAPPPNLQRPPEPAPARALPPPVAANGDAEGAKWRSKALEEKRDVERANVAGGIARENDELRTLLEARRVAQQLKERLDEAQALVLADRATAEKMFADQKGELAKEKSRSAGMEDEMRRLRQADGELRRRCDAATREAEETAAARVALTSAAAQQQRRVDTMQRQLDEQLSELRQLRSTLASQQSRATNASWNEQQRRSALQQQQQAVVESQRRAQTQGPPQPTMQQQQMAALQQQQLQAMQQQQEDALRQQHAQRQQQTQQQQMQQQQQQMQMQMQRPPQPDPAFSYEQDSPGGNPPPNAIVTTQGQWTCPHCTFSNATHRTSRTAANLCICELCNMTSRSA